MSKTKLRALLDDLNAITDRDEKMEYLIELAEEFKPVSESVATAPFPETARVPSCQSEVFAFANPEGDGLKFSFAVENPQGISAKAMASILDQTLSGAPLQEVIDVPSDIVYDIFGRNIGMGKGQGLTSMLFMVQTFARNALKPKAES